VAEVVLTSGINSFLQLYNAALIGRISQHARQGSRLSVQVSEHIHHQAQQIPRILSQA